MKQSIHIICVFFLCLYSSLQAQNKNAYRYHIDLNDIQEDGLKVNLTVPSGIGKDKLRFYFPKTVPGTYEILDFGRFVASVKAFDRKDKELKVERKDENTWEIQGAKRIARMSYIIEDTWDATNKDALFEPAGSNFEARKNFVLNGNTCFGFFKGQEKLPYELSFDRPADFYGTTSLNKIGGDFDTDIFFANNYNEVVDAPIMYCVPDTVNFKLGYGKIQISVYSPNKKVTAKELAQKVRPMLEAQNKYLGNILPVDRYNFIIYLNDESYGTKKVGALEHSRSSLFCLVEEKLENISKMLVDIAAHEFFHIVTPLYIHSEEIHNFDFMSPKMSKHLWLYEGVIEYMAIHMQAKYNIKDDKVFFKDLHEKMLRSKRYKNKVSLTELSEKCLMEPYSKMYDDVYQRGALTAMCLDLKLRLLSEGKYNIQMMLRDLSGYYGENRPFKDDELFDKIVQITEFPELRDFFAKYVEGTEPLPLNDFLNPFGVEYKEEAEVMEISTLAGIESGAVKSDSLKRFYIAKPEKLDKFGAEMLGFKKGDIILEWNNKRLRVSSVTSVLLPYISSAKEGDLLEVKVLRTLKDGKQVERTLSHKLDPIPVKKKCVFRHIKMLNESQKGQQSTWLTN